MLLAAYPTASAVAPQYRYVEREFYYLTSHHQNDNLFLRGTRRGGLMVRIENVSKWYHQLQVLSNVSLEVSEAEVVVI